MNRYRVVNSGFVAERFRELVLATPPNERPVLLQAGRWIIEELSRTPSEFGESQERLSATGWILRRGFAPPLFVEFAIDESNHIVYIKRISTNRR